MLGQRGTQATQEASQRQSDGQQPDPPDAQHRGRDDGRGQTPRVQIGRYLERDPSCAKKARQPRLSSTPFLRDQAELLGLAKGSERLECRDVAAERDGREDVVARLYYGLEVAKQLGEVTDGEAMEAGPRLPACFTDDGLELKIRRSKAEQGGPSQTKLREGGAAGPTRQQGRARGHALASSRDGRGGGGRTRPSTWAPSSGGRCS
jgi:hypothetical protein